MKNIFYNCTNVFRIKRLFGNYIDTISVFDGLYAYRGPGFAQIDLTNNCNNDCIGCWCNSPLLEEKKIDPEIKKQSLPFKRVIKLIDELYKMGASHIYYAGGGEPFMHPQIMDILRYTKKKGFTCYVNTNFTLVDEKAVKELVGLKIDHLTVSVWAGTPQVYSTTHPSKNEDTFYKIKEMLKLLNTIKHKYPIIKLYNVIFNMNYHSIETMVEFAAQTGSETVEFTVIDTIPGKTDKLLLNDKEARSLLDDCGRLKEKYGDFKNNVQLLGFEQFMRRISNIDAVSAEYDSNIIGKIPCYAGWAFVRILADGNVNSCLKSHRFPVGNILGQDFRKIWNGSLQRRFREKTAEFKQGDSFFSLIGNDPDSNMGCYKSCDNIGHNMNMHGKFTSLNKLERNALKGIANIMKTIRKIKEAANGRN
ncbi:MAG: radical SAM protein [Candidatus Omnitrophota bacterium]|nr:radical SAM protein [Candidatus Omnitrophota bacterium]